MVSRKFLGLVLFSALSLAAPTADADAEAQFDSVAASILERDALDARLEGLERRFADYGVDASLLEIRDPFAFAESSESSEPKKKSHKKNKKCKCKKKHKKSKVF
jgi:hypothetical protein